MGNTENKLDKEASMIDDYITRKCQSHRHHAHFGRWLHRGFEESQRRGHHHHLLQHLRQRQEHPLGLPRHQERRPGDQVRRSGRQVHHRQLGGKAKIGLLNCDQFEGCPPRKAGFLDQLKELPGVEVVADQAGWLADKAQPVVRSHAAGPPRHQRVVGGQ